SAETAVAAEVPAETAPVIAEAAPVAEATPSQEAPATEPRRRTRKVTAATEPAAEAATATGTKPRRTRKTAAAKATEAEAVPAPATEEDAA
ncbi:DEAD/DEAH box helicase, partial [Streptomyces sp. TRM76130]|nr:DEAD/DEAH box helicase [Streptomyces sp. TRM76130]